MYISGGSNVYPREIEEKVLKHPALAEVAILGVPDRTWGEIGVAVCVLRPGQAVNERELLTWLEPQVSRYKLPKRVFFWDELPKSAYGKITKKAVRAELEARGQVPLDQPVPAAEVAKAEPSPLCGGGGERSEPGGEPGCRKELGSRAGRSTQHRRVPLSRPASTGHPPPQRGEGFVSRQTSPSPEAPHATPTHHGQPRARTLIHPGRFNPVRIHSQRRRAGPRPAGAPAGDEPVRRAGAAPRRGPGSSHASTTILGGCSRRCTTASPRPTRPGRR